MSIFCRTHRRSGQQKSITAGQNIIDVVDTDVDISPYPCRPALPKYTNTVKATAINSADLTHADSMFKYT
jgi:hypothetical protein